MQALDALGSPIRREILEHLLRQPCSVGELATQFPVSRPAISRHLRVLTESGLLGCTTEGTRNVYAVRPEGFTELRGWLEQFWDTALARFQMVAENLE